mmetsp:Transcript_16091/g.28114  ORF Transcript_16091/g.28114 Transcript_16091/m.28114 type:complete len:323 (+) Transcript_16091:145-1113(+)|eukprot:CAMPEP_0178746492 /NCGR_PEP_ID=MMETSP0744-20121128/7837_1 /TAXON_ID=913974 /ORGANISM="Nitzschia punctata, Strain CCMP561" /LENGTH=322 /DNA_ID=CAMNT_0020399705 /DNA_START=52 /DNA_END=1020 /DNA_ORIENTATION=+
MSTSDNSTYVIDWNGHSEDGGSTLFDPYLTYSFDKYSCMVEFYFAHLVFNYFVFLSGIACFITRIWVRYIHFHKWFGRIYILSMLWSTSTSLLINNTGLPLATLISFAAVMGGLTIGWIAILVYKLGVDNKVMAEAQERLMNVTNTKDDAKNQKVNLSELLEESKQHVLSSMSWKDRFISLKTVHGVLFFVSWFQIAGRMFASDQSGNFDCYTYPVYKPIVTTEGDFTDTVTFVPTNDPDWNSLPWSNGVVAWCMMLIFGSLVAALIVGAIWTYFDVKRAQKTSAEAKESEEKKDNDSPLPPSSDELSSENADRPSEEVVSQ